MFKKGDGEFLSYPIALLFLLSDRPLRLNRYNVIVVEVSTVNNYLVLACSMLAYSVPLVWSVWSSTLLVLRNGWLSICSF